MTARPRLDAHGRPVPGFGFLNAHDAFRRDLPRFATAAERLVSGALDDDGLDALRYHWFAYRTFLEQHHGFEDGGLFPAVANVAPELKPLIEDLAAQHDELDRLLPQISDLLDGSTARPERAALPGSVDSLGRLLVPHLAAEEEHLLPVILEVMAAAPDAGPPPPSSEADAELAIPDRYGVPFTVEHLDDDVRAAVLPLFPVSPDLDAVEAWLGDYRAQLARWAPT